jgi:hypothetical protein
MLEAEPLKEDISQDSKPKDLHRLRNHIENFQMNFQTKLAFWQEKLTSINANGNRAVLWGSGSKAVAFLTTFKVFDEIQYVVDINPFKQGYYLAGTGQQIVSPEFLKDYKPNTVIIMNPVYKNEIQRDLYNMRLNVNLRTV